MRITFVLASSFSLSGGDRVIANFAKQLDARGHTVYLVSRPRRPKPWRERWKTLGQKKLNVHESHFDTLPIPRHVLETYRPVTDADVPDADVVVATWWETAEWVAVLSPRKGAKAYLIQHHETFDYLPRERVAASYHLPLHKIVLSQWLVDVMQRDYGDTFVNKTEVGVDRAQFDTPPRAKQTTPTIGFMYSPVPWKGAAVILEALERVRQVIPTLHVKTFGVDAPARALPLPPHTEFLQRPPQTKLAALYARCDVWVCGSWSEGFSLPPLEAMAMRCPVVATRVGGLGDVIREGVNGYLVEPGDVAGLAAGIVNVLQSDEARWRTISDAAYAAVQDYTWERAADRFEAGLHLAVERAPA